MNATIEGKHIDELNLVTIKEQINKINEPEVLKNNRTEFAEKAFELDLPGIPDETWRRINLSKLKLNDYHISRPVIKIKNDNLENYFKKGLIIQKIDSISKENEKFIETIINKIKNKDLIWKDIAYSSDIKETKFLAISESLFKDVLFIKIPAGLKIEETIIIEIIHNTENGIILPQIYIYSEENSSINVMMEYKSNNDFKALSLGVMKTYAEKSSEINLFSFQNFNKNTMSFHNEFIMLETGAKVHYDNISIGSKTSLWENTYTLFGRNSDIKVNKLISTKGKQFLGNKILTEHFSPFTDSDVEVKSALNDSSNTLFLGKIVMPKMAQKCNGYENSENIILGKKAMAYIIPQLEIIADDVACSHGGTVGSIDEEQLFYLTSRGIEKENAEKLIVKAFYRDILNDMIILNKDESINKNIINQLSDALEINFNEEEY